AHSISRPPGLREAPRRGVCAWGEGAGRLGKGDMNCGDIRCGVAPDGSMEEKFGRGLLTPSSPLAIVGRHGRPVSDEAVSHLPSTTGRASGRDGVESTVVAAA